MDERRQKQRHRTLKTGVVTLNHGGGFDCVVRNLSDIGACLEFESPVGIPETFMLMVKPERVQHPCQVIWRSPRKIGVSFQAAHNLSNEAAKVLPKTGAKKAR